MTRRLGHNLTLFTLIIGFFAMLSLLSADIVPPPQALSDSLLALVTGAEQLRFFGGYKQGTDSSCGISATATLLRFFYGIPITEKYLIDKFFAAMEAKNDLTVSMLDIKNVCESYGFTTKGVKTDLTTLAKLDKYIPIVIHFLKPRAHFTLFLGTYNQFVFIDDPSEGAFFLNADEFNAKFSGYALFVFGMDSLKNVSLINDIRSTLTKKIIQLYQLSAQRIIQ